MIDEVEMVSSGKLAIRNDNERAVNLCLRVCFPDANVWGRAFDKFYQANGNGGYIAPYQTALDSIAATVLLSKIKSFDLGLQILDSNTAMSESRSNIPRAYKYDFEKVVRVINNSIRKGTSYVFYEYINPLVKEELEALGYKITETELLDRVVTKIEWNGNN